jgi:methyltransferase (TIGR00027 family)
MRDDMPSLTAIYVAFARALASHDRELSRACSDPYAEALLPSVLKPLLRRADRRPVLCAALRQSSLGLIDHLALRTGLIDGAVEHAVSMGMGSSAQQRQQQHDASGIEQVVLLGAGLDARAHRMRTLASATVFEVDHPATQRIKQQKARHLPRAARELRYAACDFQRTGLADALAGAGFDPSARSLWVWEGVTMYLPAAVVAESLRTIARLSAVDSVLVATYLTPDMVVGGQLLGRWSSAMLGVVSEPIRFVRTPDELADMLAHASFDVLSDALPVEAAPHFGVDVMRPTSLMPKEHIAVAMKRGDQP